MAEADTLSLKTALKATERPVSSLHEAESSRQEPIPGQPSEKFEVDENAAVTERVWPSGPKLWLNMAAILLCVFIRGLDLTIVAVAVPSLTNQFNTVADIGWYGAAYMLVSSATNFTFGKVYALFDLKRTYMMSIVMFWLGSAICTFAPSSNVFIFGRAVSGLANSWQSGGALNLINNSFPLEKRPFWIGIINFVSTAAMVGAPIIGGGLIQWFSWRACFGINLPLNALALAFTAYSMQTATDNPDIHLPLKEKIIRLDLPSTAVITPALILLALALQWGGTQYQWQDARVISILVISVVLLAIFAYMQYRLQEKALLPPRIVMQRSILAGAWFNACCDGTLATTESYLSIYFQGVRGLTPAKSGLLGVPMIVGLCAAALTGGFGIGFLGYYTPFMLATSLVAPVASGLLTTLNLDSQVGKAAGLLGLLGFALGLGMQGPMIAVSTILPTKDVAIGIAVTGFGAGMGSAFFTSIAAVLFKNRLTDEIRNFAPGANITTIETAGLSKIRSVIGPDRLKQVLTGYDKAVVQTLYIPLALTILTIVGSALTEWRSTKKKQS